LETVVTAKRDKAAALKFLKRIMKKYGQPRRVVTDGLCSYPAAMKEIGNADRHEVGRRLNNRAENSHQPFRRRERAMQRFRSAKTLQKFSSVHAQVHNHFNQERHLVAREIYKQRRSAALAEWGTVMPDPHLEFRVVAPNAYRDASDPILSDRASKLTPRSARTPPKLLVIPATRTSGASEDTV
jgi:hypothetical protein